ncbi:minor capsid protein [Lactobacillus crispatus]|uniref:minor capsid protein n=1 Tax=Lactobacillus crispatus TaxID=47770 RepID=UPI00254ED14E|nr:minor capsid protein [Lactobacillus crispatus]MDK6376765.1 minor capsid protein [Lactobacillus crispatus]
MGQAELDLKKQLCKSIRKGTGLDVKPGFLLPVNTLGIVEDPGSNPISTDMAGISTWKYNYSITFKTSDLALANTKLQKISDYLHGLNTLKSENGSFLFQSIEVSSAPNESMEDLKGVKTYSLAFTVIVMRRR